MLINFILASPLGRFFETLLECFPHCLVVQVPINILVHQPIWPLSAILDFSCYHISSETRKDLMEFGYCVHVNVWLCFAVFDNESPCIQLLWSRWLEVQN